ncbi:uncharacterized protein LOC135210742 [Macrobrachium nipponense]|uniref:uncharacterized protein LOC135210742 n=1 Tax=Macrobrachium nipponense TaxID=159736 RepID=UPI0030C7C902
MTNIMSAPEKKKVLQALNIVRQKFRGKQMLVADLQSENALLKRHLFLGNRANVAQNSPGPDSRSVPLSNNLEASTSQPSTSFLVSRALRQSEQLPPNVSVSGLQVRTEVQQSQNNQVQLTQQLPMTSLSQAQTLPAQSSLQVAPQQPSLATDLEEIESFIVTIQHQLQASQSETKSSQAAVNSRLSQQPIHNSGKHTEDVEVTYVASMTTVQSHKRTQTQQPLPKQTNTSTNNLQTLHYPAQQPSHSPQGQKQSHRNSAENLQFPQHSLLRHIVQRSHNPEQVPKNTTQNIHGPQNSSQQPFAQRPQNLPQIHPSQHPQQPHLQGIQQVNNSGGHMHPPLGSQQPLDQRICNANQIESPANYNVQSQQQHRNCTFFPQPSYRNSSHHFPPTQYSPQQHFQRPQNPQNLQPSHHCQSGRSTQDHSISQQTLQNPQVPPPPKPVQIQPTLGQANQAALPSYQHILGTLQRPQESPDYSYQKLNDVGQSPRFRAPLLPKQRYQQPNTSARNIQGAPSSIQQLPSIHGLEQAHIDHLNQFNASQRSPNGSNSKNMHPSGGQVTSTVNSIPSKNTFSQSNSQESPEQNREQQVTQTQTPPINVQENRQNLPVTGMETTETNIQLRNQQNSGSLAKSSTELTHSFNQNRDLSDIKLQKKQREFLSQPGIQNVRDIEGPFVNIIKEEPLSEMSENCVGTKIRTKDSLDVSEFFHLEEITAVPAAKISRRPEVVSGTEKRVASRESSLERNVDIPPHAIITPPQTPPTPIPSTSGRSTSPVMSINTIQVMKKLSSQDYNRTQQVMVDSDFTYCKLEKNNENSIAISNTVSHVTEAPSKSLQSLSDIFLERKKSRGPGSFLSRSLTGDISVDGSELEGNKSTTREKCSQESSVKSSSKNKENGPKEIAGLKQPSDLRADLATDLSSTSPDNAGWLAKCTDKSIKLLRNNNVLETTKRQDQELTFSCSEEADKTHEESRVLFSNSKEVQSCVMPDNSQKEIAGIEGVGTSSEFSAVESLVVFSTSSSTVYKSNENISQNKKNIEDSPQRVRHSSGKRSSRDKGEISRTEYVIESVKSEPVNKGLKSLSFSQLESSLSELNGFVEYVHVTDHREELEIISPRKIKGARDGLKDLEVSPHASDVQEEKWTIQESSVNNDDTEKSDYFYKIFLCTDEVTGRVTNPEVIPECCPMCYTAICPSRITVNTDTFDMVTVCIGCELTILMSWMVKADAGINKRRPGPRSRRRIGPKRLRCNTEQ